MIKYKKPLAHKLIKDMKKVPSMGTLIRLRWDYECGDDTFIQHMWNQTLMTTINNGVNFLSDRIGFINFNIITTNINVMSIIDSMTLFQPILSEQTDNHIISHGILMDRFVVQVDYSMTDNIVYVGTDDEPQLVAIYVENL